MIPNRIAKLALLAASLLAASLFATAAQAETISVNATLIMASNDGQGVDASLRQYEKKLTRIFPYDTFRKQGAGKIELGLSQSKTIALSGGQSVTISYLAKEGDRYRLSAHWTSGSRTLTQMVVLANKGMPTVQGAKGTGGSIPILIMVAN